MLIRTQAGYANLATISEAELHDDNSITLRWGTHSQRYTDLDAAALRQGLDRLAGVTRLQRASASPLPHDEEEDLHAAGATQDRPAAAAPVLKLHAQASRFPSPTGDAPRLIKQADASAESAEGTEAGDEVAKPESALSRRAHLVMGFEPIASLSHKQRGLFLAAIDKAPDFNHLSPKFRRLIQDAEARRREELRQ